MSLYNKIKNALSSTTLPIRRTTLSEADASKNYEQYIIVYFLNEYGELFADDEEVQTTNSIQISLFSKKNFDAISKQIKQNLKDIGFIRSSEFESYEDDTGYYHKVIRFYNADETEEI